MPVATKICEFVNNKAKPDWWRYTLNKAIELGKLSTTELEVAYLVAKMEYGLEDKCPDYSVLVKPAKATGYHTEIEENKLISIGNIKNISALASQQKIEFSATGLTVIYGNNGVGKSSYAKILKNACLTRGEIPELKHNVFKGGAGFPSAEIQVQSNQKLELVQWNTQIEPHPHLKAIRVFDSDSSIHYLTKTGILDFKPTALKLLDELLIASAFILDKAKTEEVIYSPLPILPSMNVGTTPSKLVISHLLTEEEVDLLCATQNELNELSELRKEVVELNNNSPLTLRLNYQKRRLRLLPLQIFLTNLVQILNLESITRLKSIYDVKNRANLAATEFSISTFSNLKISNLGSDQWLVMMNAVKSFIENSDSYKNDTLQIGDACPTCLQELDINSVSRLELFDSYLQSELQKDSSIASKNWEIELGKIRVLNFSIEPYKAILAEINEKDNSLGLLFYNLIDALKERGDNLLQDQPVFGLSEIEVEALTRLNMHIKKLEEAEKLVLDDEGKLILIQNKNLRIKEIEDREKILTLKDQIKAEIKKAKKIDCYTRIKRSTSTSTITSLNNEICNTSPLGRIQEFFNDELKKLGFEHFKINALTKGVKGNQNFSVQIAENNLNVLEIASEGEQKCIALASFFAELTTDDRKSAIIFDDPVNSLDHIWRLKFATRITEESKFRQVIVFTHDLPFLKMLQETAEEIVIQAITRNKTETGICIGTPPWDALKTDKRIGKLKEKLVRARKIAKESDEQYQQDAGIIYGLMRETWERLIEEWLIRGVVERFNREVKTQNVRYLKDITDSDIATINSAMSKCSTYMNGHDMSEGISGAFPDANELESDIANLEAYFSTLKKRRS
ncbi:AAA family ATPase [Acinetobacter junii]|uniref:AAA family ATPase n=1 Tax=Acinetobacter junii TaxID=40215 RepID=UPI003A89494E